MDNSSDSRFSGGKLLDCRDSNQKQRLILLNGMTLWVVRMLTMEKFNLTFMTKIKKDSLRSLVVLDLAVKLNLL